MARINTNVPALQAGHRLGRNFGDLQVRLERLATGLRINRGKDDPAGLIASERLRFEIRATEQAIENSTRADNVIATTEGALNEANSLLLDLQALVVEAANKGALTPDEVAANQLQIDSILSSLDRIANTTTFGSKKLLDGSEGYQLSSIPTNALASVQVYAARLSNNVPRTVTVQVTQSAETAQLTFLGNNVGSPATTSASTIELRGNIGTEVISFASGATLADVRTAINSVTAATGVSAVVSSVAVGTGASALILNSTEYGSEQFVSVSPIQGSFVVTGNAGQAIDDSGVDAGVIVDGQAAQTRGLQADVRTSGLDTRIYLTSNFATSLSSATFNVTGGGTLFQLTPEVTPNGQIHVGFNTIRSTQLGNSVVGRLYELRSGAGNDLSSQNFLRAQKIILESIDQVSSFRGRLGNIQRNTIQTNIASQSIALENITASESVIRDADMAAEVSALTRAQILVQSTQSTLQIANSVPNLVLSLLG